LDEYVDLIQSLPEGRIKVRIGLSLYSHLSEASGIYEVPKNMMRITSGDGHIIWPFVHLVDRHATTGQAISPNAVRPTSTGLLGERGGRWLIVEGWLGAPRVLLRLVGSVSAMLGSAFRK
jgi:hypothetical protein